MTDAIEGGGRLIGQGTKPNAGGGRFGSVVGGHLSVRFNVVHVADLALFQELLDFLDQGVRQKKTLGVVKRKLCRVFGRAVVVGVGVMFPFRLEFQKVVPVSLGIALDNVVETIASGERIAGTAFFNDMHELHEGLLEVRFACRFENVLTLETQQEIESPGLMGNCLDVADDRLKRLLQGAGFISLVAPVFEPRVEPSSGGRVPGSEFAGLFASGFGCDGLE